nr:helix-turn-helix transcriptional regulator [Pantoea agglomerans]
MEQTRALIAFSALAHESRLRIVRMLVVAGADGMSAGDIAAALDASSPSK